MCDSDNKRTEYIIQSRIRDYEYDVQSCENLTSKSPEDIERIRQDKVIIKELNAILYGEGLETLVYQE